MSTNPYESPDTASEAPQKPGPPVFKFRLVELLVVLGVIGILVGLLLPSIRYSPGAGKRSMCLNNLKQIGLALHNYHDTYKALPPAYTVDANGKPLHSWRTLILPYLEQQAVYDQLDLSKPWDDPINKAVFDKANLHNLYQCPSANIAAGQTTYLAIVGPDTCLQPTTSHAFGEITDGTSRTLMVMEFTADQAVPWMSPRDATPAMVCTFGKSKKHSHPGGAQAVFADGSTRFLSAELPPDVLQALITASGGDDVAKEFD